jgi:hypothetical protein
MLTLKLLFRGGHSEIVELSDDDPSLAKLFTAVGRPPAKNDSSELFNLICAKQKTSLVFNETVLLGILADRPLELVPHREQAFEGRWIAPEPVIIIDDFVPAEDNQRLLSFAASNEGEFRPATTAGSRQSELRKGVALINPPSELREFMMLHILPLIPSICEAFNISYRALDEFECQMTSYGNGDYFSPHVDLIEYRTGIQRMISYSYYVHATPRRFCGGALEIVGNDVDGTESRTITVESLNNRMVFFPSAAVHGVTTVSLEGSKLVESRLSINGWIKGRW